MLKAVKILLIFFILFTLKYSNISLIINYNVQQKYNKFEFVNKKFIIY